MTIGEHKPYIFLILFILLLFHGLNNYYILTKSRYCLGPDSVSHFSHVLQTFRALREFKLNPKSVYETYDRIFRNDLNPPLFFITASPFLLFGINKNNVTMANLIYFAILLFATYGIGKKLYNFKVGLLSAFLVSMFPTVFALSRVLMPDFALMAMVALTFYLFILNRFDSLKFSLLTGIVIGLGMLTKQGYFIFLLPILFYFFLQKDNLKNKKIIKNVIFLISVGLFITFFYYIYNGHNYRSGFLHMLLYNKEQLSSYSRHSAYFYLQSILFRQLLPFFSLLFLISLFFYFFKKKYFLPIMIFILLIFFSKYFFKADRYILPIFPYVAVMISGFVWSLAKIRRAAIIVLVLFSFLQYFTICYGGPLFMSYRPLQEISSFFDEGVLNNRGLFFRIDEGDWQGPSEELINIIDNEGNKIDRDIKVLFIGQERRIHITIDYLWLVRGSSNQLNRPEPNPTFLFLNKWHTIIDNQMIDQFDFIIVEQIPHEKMSIHAAFLYSAFKQRSNKFNFIKTISFPNGSLCNIYKNKLYKKN